MATVKHWEQQIDAAITVSLKNDIRMRIHLDTDLNAYEKVPLMEKLRKKIWGEWPLQKKEHAITYEQLLELPWDREYGHLLKPGYDNIDGNYNYFGTDPKGKRIITVNTTYVGHTFVRIEEDCGTRCVFNGHVTSFEQLKLINSLVL